LTEGIDVSLPDIEREKKVSSYVQEAGIGIRDVEVGHRGKARPYGINPERTNRSWSIRRKSVEARYGMGLEELDNAGILSREPMTESNLIDTASGLEPGVVIKRRLGINLLKTNTTELFGGVQGKGASEEYEIVILAEEKVVNLINQGRRTRPDEISVS